MVKRKIVDISSDDAMMVRRGGRAAQMAIPPRQNTGCGTADGELYTYDKAERVLHFGDGTTGDGDLTGGGRDTGCLLVKSLVEIPRGASPLGRRNGAKALIKKFQFRATVTMKNNVDYEYRVFLVRDGDCTDHSTYASGTELANLLLNDMDVVTRTNAWQNTLNSGRFTILRSWRLASNGGNGQSPKTDESVHYIDFFKTYKEGGMQVQYLNDLADPADDKVKNGNIFLLCVVCDNNGFTASADSAHLTAVRYAARSRFVG